MDITIFYIHVYLDLLGPSIQDVVNVEVFERAQNIQKALLLHHDLDPIVSWCQDHASKLRRRESPLEYIVKVQQCLHLLQTASRIEAFHFASEQLAPLANIDAPLLQRVMGLLAFDDIRMAPAEFVYFLI